MNKWSEVEVKHLWIDDIVQGFGKIEDIEPQRTDGACGDSECCPGGPEIYSWKIYFQSGAEIIWDRDTKVLAWQS